jgi:hypothetical protein
MEQKLSGKFKVLVIPDTNIAVGVLNPMGNEESVLDMYSYWHKPEKKRYKVHFTINFFLKGCLKLTLPEIPKEIELKNGKVISQIFESKHF